MRSDTFCTNLGSRSSGMSRLWVEDSYRRLSRNGFEVGTQFARRSRPGYGVILTPSVLGECAVSSRRGVPLLSLENGWLAKQMPSRDAEVRVRVCVGSVIVMPRLRIFHVGRTTHELATISEGTVEVGGKILPLHTAKPAAFGLIAELKADLNWSNLVLATEVMGNSRPSRVQLSGDALCVRLAGKFLSEGGYAPSLDDSGVWLSRVVSA